MPLALAPLVLVVLVQFGGALADPFLRGLPALQWTTPTHAPDEVGRASTYGRAKDSHRQAFMAAAEHLRLTDEMYVCAHRKHRHGTVLLLEHVRTGRTTLCRVMDRGPYGRRDAVTGEWFNGAREPDRAGTWRGFLDLSPAVRRRLGPDGSDGGLQPVRAWVLSRPARSQYVRRARVGV